MLDSARQPREMRLTPRNTVLSMTFDDSAVIAASPALYFQVFTRACSRASIVRGSNNGTAVVVDEYYSSVCSLLLYYWSEGRHVYSRAR